MTDGVLRPLRPLQQSPAPADNDDRRHDDRNTSNAGTFAAISQPARPFKGQKRATCSQCRIRKVRCDGREGLCQNCDRLGFECSFQQSPGQTPGQYALKPPERRRRMQACIPCHDKKTRCLGELPICSCCARKGLTCVYPPARRALGHQQQQHGAGGDDDASSLSTTAPEDVIMAEAATTASSAPQVHLDPQTALGKIEDYFRHLHLLPTFAFLHRPTVIKRCQDGTINEPLKLAICAITSLHLKEERTASDHWMAQAEQQILAQVGRPSIFHLQALLLIVRYRIESGEFPTAFMLAALAARTAVALRLNYERSELAFVAQEARRRLFWGLYLLDDYFCVGLREFELCPEETIYLQLPCREDFFQAEQQCNTGMLRPGPNDNVSAMGLLGTFIRVTSSRRAAMRFNRRVGLGEESSSTIGERIRQFEQDLAALYSALGPECQYSIANLTSTRWRAQFAMLHMSYHQCHCDLYRMFLTGYDEAAPTRVLASIQQRDCLAMQAKCLEHAEAIIRIQADLVSLCDSDSTSDVQLLLERDAAVCAFESARLVMFGAARLPGCATSTLDVALRKASEVSLRVITEFFPYSASTRPLRTGLEHLIKSYSIHQAQEQQQQQLQRKQRRTIATEEEEEEARRLTSKVSQYANSRQRLSVQSLLLQSNFVDDSEEIAAGPSSYPSNSGVIHHSIGPSRAVNPSNNEIQGGGGRGERRKGPKRTKVHNDKGDSSTLSISSSASPPATSYTPTSAPTPSPTNIVRSEISVPIPIPPGVAQTSLEPSFMPHSQAPTSTGSMPFVPPYSSAPFPPTGVIAPDVSNQLQFQHHQQQPPFSAASSAATTIDAVQEDAGLIFNPWMGFTANEDIYYGLGLSGAQFNEEY